MEEKWVSSRKYFHLKQFFFDFNSRMIFYNVDIEKEVKKKRTQKIITIFNSIFNNEKRKELIIINGRKVTFFSKILSTMISKKRKGKKKKKT